MMSSNPYPQPYVGAPPIPQGYNVNPSQWNTGVWQRNPRYNSNLAPAQAPQAAWVPGAAWGQPQQSYNPYKRQHNPPSAAYLAQKLSDNPLGLTNMIPREELYGPGVDGAPPETPWIWNPRNLDDAGSNSNRRLSDNPRQSSEPPPSAFHYSQSQSLTRHASEPPPDNHQTHQEPAPAPLARPKKYAVSPSTQATHASASNQSRTSATSSASAYALSQAAAAANSTKATNTTSDAPPPPAASTPTRTFRPTFSTRIVRTPDHYRHDDSENPINSNNSNLVRSATMPSSTVSTSQNYASPSRSRSQSTSHTRNASAETATGVSTGAGTVTDASVFVDEPGNLLSPLIMNTPMPATSKPLGRHHTAPALSTIQEQASPSEQRHHRHHHHSHRRRSSSRHPDGDHKTPSKSRSSSNSKTPTPGAQGESGTNTNYFSSRNNADGISSASAAAAATALHSQSQSQTTPPNPSNTASLFGNRTPNPLPTPPRVFDMNHPSYSRVNKYSPPTGVGSSTTIAYTTPLSAPAHGSSTTMFGVMPVMPTSAGVSSASASASASAQAQASLASRSRSQTQDDTRDHARAPSQSREGPQQERSYSRARSRETSRSRDPSSDPAASRFADQSRYSEDSYPFIAPDGLPPAEQGPEYEARMLAELSKRFVIRGEPPRMRKTSMQRNVKYDYVSGAGGISSAPAATTTFEHFPLPTPPESFLEQRRQEARKEEERLKREKDNREREQRDREQKQQQQYSTYQTPSSYQTPKTSPYNSNHNNSPQRSPSYVPQYSSASRQASPYPSPHNSAQQRSSPYPSPNNDTTSTQRSPYPSPNNAPQRSPYPSPYSTVSSTQPSPRPSPSKHSQHTHHSNQGVGSGTNPGGHRIRKGYWNSRGDHLTPSGYIVYAPPDKANPPELASYPGQWTGFQDEYGQAVKFEVGRKELPESLPRNGRLPERPYDSFVRYV